MFTGIIQKMGTVKKISTQNGITTLNISVPAFAQKMKIGDSISIDGSCLTISQKTMNNFSVQAIPETLEKTIIKNYKIGQKVNLELPLKMNQGLDGHLVTGHIDLAAKIKEIKKNGASKILNIEFPITMAKYFAMKGSVTVNGVSLTISKIHTDSFEVSLIPLTQKITNLGTIKKGEEVNIEIDLIVRYLENLLNGKEKEITYNFLQERGFI